MKNWRVGAGGLQFGGTWEPISQSKTPNKFGSLQVYLKITQANIARLKPLAIGTVEKLQPLLHANLQ